MNRVDEIVVFHRLTEAHIATIVGLQVHLLRGRLADRDLGLELSPAAIEWIARAGYDPDYGARPLKRVIQKELADPIALALLKGEYHDGDIVVVDATTDGDLVFVKQSPVSAS